MKAIYTDAAQRELAAFQSRQQEMLENIVAERKLVLGDDLLEITASDIKAVSERIRIYQPTLRTSQSTEFVTRAYIIIGFAMMIGAFFYPQLVELYASNRIQALTFFMGAIMAAIGGGFNYWIQARRRREQEYVKANIVLMRGQMQEVTKSAADDQSEV